MSIIHNGLLAPYAGNLGLTPSDSLFVYVCVPICYLLSIGPLMEYKIVIMTY